MQSGQGEGAEGRWLQVKYNQKGEAGQWRLEGRVWDSGGAGGAGADG